MASYKMLDKGNWKVTISLGYDNMGKRRRVIKQGFRTKKLAEAFATQILNKKNHGFISPTDSDMLFKDFIMKWYDMHTTSLKLSLNTRNDYLSRINTNLIPLLGNYKIKDISIDVVQNFYNTLIDEKNLKPVTVKKYLDILSSCLKYAQSKDLIYKLPTSYIQKVKIKKPKIEYWNQKEVNFFLNYIKNTYLYTPIFIDILTGLRIGELCGLRWCDVDLQNGIITVNHQLIHDKRLKVLMLTDLKTSSSHRKITIPKVLIDYLKELKNDRNATDTGYVVLDRNDFKYTPRSLSMNFTKKVAKFSDSKENHKDDNFMQLKQISFHGLRHTHATLLIANGENIKVVSERLGHTDIRMTLNTYTHVLDSMKNNTANLLNNMFK
ncbi:site-specific integrase [Clostridium botulinum]|uniref:site-specific integrase n=1 Tax=Clostridium botulinum TaxID=1491 RepID=UPI0019688D1E|nr:tyrosine-type recombinase/integrase [Clostridium botulinum]MBN1069598.1 site-specific integrase [Clostridium botulinum]